MNKSISLEIPNIENIFTTEQINLNNYYYLKQIHSNTIHIVDDNYQNNSEGDALITTKLNTPLVIRTADCIPILIYDKNKKILSLVHSGWKGTLNSIITDVINKLINEFNSQKEDLSVYLYPAIRKCHFEVDEDVYLLFKNKITNINKYISINNQKYHIDLEQIVIDELKELGINSITDTNICTYCHHDEYYSYRYNKTNNRNYLIAKIKE